MPGSAPVLCCVIFIVGTSSYVILEVFAERPEFIQFRTSDSTYKSVKSGRPTAVAGMDVRWPANGRPVFAWDMHWPCFSGLCKHWKLLFFAPVLIVFVVVLYFRLSFSQ